MTTFDDNLRTLRLCTTQRDDLRRRIAAVLAIHAEDDGRCTYCRHPDGTGEYVTPAWPCPTVVALTEEAP